MRNRANGTNAQSQIPARPRADAGGSETYRSLDEAVAAAQAIMARVVPPMRVLSDELIAERRAIDVNDVD